ncbi:2-polyprenyl-6-methoxyphenol hydroxylase [Streptoalloteichus tenebrarius]|uniref:2-polyprenyl-6-methoxyphenol hydroxylase n=1 Tax=Streptoalloteichus tenebrarius (strain ATCC 17920 / DSM 40477 / JCM 4838 / CBS 697.72 / NBRC 16177 / NCIMB 11028 / NRRL B-12390 / A12253. 1 / ISP 5477) TaxID=1933 RepID=A0ABT1HQQ0_STRSD|nr:FAD-dependent monooxygenase [Streptoalloteichus tenebrarius]MCP2257828.1 2-polyprenyl-6-methoxyphenol hydroxylase [Streptoalloteichus tenebrarius]BFE99810.1 monooxygenase [Streptoalloteichus tenebrarius]
MGSVVVVGAGPTGLALAAELAGAGVACRVLEKRARPTPWSRACGVEPRTLELLDLRGGAAELVDRGLPWARQPVGDGRAFLDYGRLDTPHPYILIIPQHRTEEVLEAQAVRAGAEIARGARVVDMARDDDAVTLTVAGEDRTWTERADYVVGCDGVRSTVRELAGIGFHGHAYEQSLVVADVRLHRPPDPEVDARITGRGMVAVFPFGDGLYRLIVLDRDRMAAPADEPVTVAELRDSVVTIFGWDLGVHDPWWMSRFRCAERQAERYRLGRVLLAGDAAHTHMPSGGQGLQLGVQDAFNLGWKLAAEVAGWAPPGLLDSYERERWPIAARMLRRTELAFRYETSSSLPARAVRRIGYLLMRFGPLQMPVIRQFAGFTLRYPPPPSAPRHRLVGRRLPDARLRADHGVVRLLELFRRRRFVLLDQGAGVEGIASAWADRVDVVRATVLDGRRWPDVVLFRPDAFVAWAGSRSRLHRLSEALSSWCGAPSPRATADVGRHP